MKKHFLYTALICALAFLACEKEDNNETGEGEKKPIDYGKVEALIQANTITGEPIAEVSMGETVSFLDVSKGRPDSVKWIFNGGIPSESSAIAPIVTYIKPGAYDVKLEVYRSSDGTKSEINLPNYITVKSIPVSATFRTSKAAEDKIITVSVGEEITFENTSKGYATNLTWELVGSSKASSTEPKVTVTYAKEGVYSVKLMASRMDGTEKVADEIIVTDYIKVVKPDVRLYTASAANKEVILKYGAAMMADLASIKGNFSVKIKTAKGADIIPEITDVKRGKDKTNIIISLKDKVYSDDKVMVSLKGADLKEENELFVADAFTDEICTYSKNLIAGGHCDDPSQWDVASASIEAEMVTEKTYQGTGALKVSNVNGGGFIYCKTPFAMEKDAIYSITFEGMKVSGSADEAFAVRFGTGLNQKTFLNGKDKTGIHQLYSSVGNVGDGEYKTRNPQDGKPWSYKQGEVELMKYIGDPKDKVYFYFLFNNAKAGGAEVLFDNIVFCKYDPRP